MGETLPIIKSMGSCTYLTKVWGRSKDGSPCKYTPDNAPLLVKHAARFTVDNRPVESLDDIKGILETGHHMSAVLRDEPIKADGAMRRNKDQWEPKSRRWFMLDIDDFQHDPLAGPESCVFAVLAKLEDVWPETKDADVLWQFSASHGFKSGVSLHLWFWSDAPLASHDLKRKVVECNGLAGWRFIDEALFNPVQIHYTAKPRLMDGQCDPVPRARVGIVKRDGDLKTSTIKRQVQEVTQRPIIKPTPSPRAVQGREPNLKYIRSIAEGVISDASSGSDGRKRRLFASASRMGSICSDHEIAAAIVDMGYSSMGRCELINAGVQAGLTWKRAAVDVDNGLKNGQQNPEPNHKLWQPRTAKPTPIAADNTPAGFTGTATKEETRRQMPVKLAEMNEGASLLIGLRTGNGKTYALREHARQTPDDVVRIYVLKDRKAAIESGDAIDGAVVMLGKSGAGAPITDAWTPHRTVDDYSSCGNPSAWAKSRRGGSSRKDCVQCPFKAACSSADNPGSRGQWLLTDKALRRGGVIIATPQLLRPIIAKHEQLEDAAPIDLIWFDDLPLPPGNSEIKQGQLKDAAMRLTGEERSALERVVWTLGAAESELAGSDYGKHETVDETRARLQGVNTTALRSATERDGVPLALNDLASFIDGEDTTTGYTVKSSKGATYEVRTRLELPIKAKIVISSATAQPAEWSAWIGRDLEIWKPYTPVKVKATWCQSGLFHTKRVNKTDKDKLIAAASREGESLKATLAGSSRILIVAHNSVIKSDVYSDMIGALLKAAGSTPSVIKSIHWRGVDQVGSDDFNGWDTVLTLGDPNLNLGAWERRKDTAIRWGGDRAADLDYQHEAGSWTEQADGRPRWPIGLALVHIGHCPGFTLKASHPRIINTSRGRPQSSTLGAEGWFNRSGFKAIGRALANTDNAPSRKAISDLFAKSDKPRWVVRLSGRGANQVWKADNKADVFDAIRLLCGGGVLQHRLISINPDDSGIVHRIKKRLNTKAHFGSMNEPDGAEIPPSPEQSKKHKPMGPVQCVQLARFKPRSSRSALRHLTSLVSTLANPEGDPTSRMTPQAYPTRLDGDHGLATASPPPMVSRGDPMRCWSLSSPSQARAREAPR